MKENKLLTLLRMFKGELVLVLFVGVGSVILVVTPDEYKHVVLPVLRSVIQILIKDGSDGFVE